jgi:hypothetical protein
LGLNFNYLLYFPKNRLWDVLTDLSTLCESTAGEPTTIKFPDHELNLPLAISWGESDVVPHDQDEYEFAISMVFDEDPAILEYLANRGDDLEERSPPEDGAPNRYAIGFIYLTVYADLEKHYAFKAPNEMVLLKFGTTGTKMSLLFSESTSIKKAFIKLLENHHGISGIFDWENDYGELFWFRGEAMQFSLSSNYLLPEEIEVELKRGW